MSSALLTVENLTKSFGAIVANDDVTLSFEPGECHGIIGPNGSGKTTLFDLITGFHKPDKGTIRFNESDITDMAPDQIARRGLVRTFQIVSPFEEMTVKKNLLSVYKNQHKSKIRVPEEKINHAEGLLETLELTQVADHSAEEISGGQQKLLELGRALMLEPECLLLDEPTAGVNPTIQKRVLSTLQTINERGTTLIVIEHDMNVIKEISDRITVFNDGQVIAQGDFETVTDHDQVRDAYLGQYKSHTTDMSEMANVTKGNNKSPPAISKGTNQSLGTSEKDDSKHVPKRVPTTNTKDEDTLLSEENDSLPQGVEVLGRHHSDTGSPDYLKAQDVVAGYGNQIVLHGVSIQSHDGVTCLLGPNGSGKSTLLKAIGGVIPVRSGTIKFGKETITGLDPQEVIEAGITTVPQRNRIFRGLTVRENLQLGAMTVENEKIINKRMEAVLDLFPALQASISDRAQSLSGGQQLMLGLARAMMTGADIYLLDEPLSGLAPSMIDDVLDAIMTLNELGTQIIMVEQQVSEALRIADHVYILSQGRIRFDGKPTELQNQEFIDLYLGLE
ncbi:MAG: ATP-binding cassette domain-containing protein [Halobacteriaceae archaeon]